MIINIRGTNGSGKSTVVREVMRVFGPARPIYGLLGAGRPEAYRLGGMVTPWFVVGPYDVPTGGVDAVGGPKRVLVLLDKYANRGHLLFEGAMISDHVGVVGQWLLSRASDVLVAYMSTPMETCVSRILTRRKVRGTEAEFNPDKTVRPREKRIAAARATFAENPLIRIIDLPTDNPAAPLLRLMEATS